MVKMCRVALCALGSIAATAGCSSTPDGGRDLVGASGGNVVVSGGVTTTSGGVIASGGAASGGFLGGGGIMVPKPDPTSTEYVADHTDLTGLPAEQVTRLKAGGAGCTEEIIYPYENTTFPGALPAPPIMWAGDADAAYVHMRYEGLDTVDYQFAIGASSPGVLRIPQDAWNEITRRSQNSDLKVTVNVERGGAVISSCVATWKVAPGNMTGSIYYNTYNAPDVVTPGNGAVMRLPLGEPQSEIYLQFEQVATPVLGPCVSCHSVSFDGSTIVAATHLYAPFGGQNFEVWGYEVTEQVQPPQGASLPNANFGALTPSGEKLLAFGNPDCSGGSDTFPRSPNNFPLIEGPDHARLLNTATGQEIAATGLSPDMYMWMPQFSPAGDKVVFNHARPDGAGGTNRRELAIMDYDDTTNTFSNLRIIATNLGPAPSLAYSPIGAGAGPTPAGENGCVTTDSSLVGALPSGSCTGPCYPAYPFFTPDGNGVVFAMISEPDFSSAFPGRSKPAKGELWYVRLDTDEGPIPLDNINKTLHAENALQDYYPTVLPVAIGGKFWVVWTSRRAFGHQDTGVQGIAGEEDPLRKRLWAAAIRPPNAEEELGGRGDPSSPGFYLEGQSISGNVRGFATLNPCKATDGECTSGLDCCTGFCAVADGATVGVCTEDIPECSKTNEKCETDANCCPPGLDEPSNTCVAGYCSFL